MVRAVRQQQPDAVFHLGDCERDTQRLEKEFPDLPLYRVCGNCDREPVNPEVLQCTLDGVKFFCTHGDRYGVKYTLDALLNEEAIVEMYLAGVSPQEDRERPRAPLGAPVSSGTVSNLNERDFASIGA